MTEEPTHLYVVMQDHGDESGWGPATLLTDWGPMPLITTRDSLLPMLESAARKCAQDTGKRTKLVRFTRDTELLTIGGSS